MNTVMSCQHPLAKKMLNTNNRLTPLTKGLRENSFRLGQDLLHQRISSLQVTNSYKDHRINSA